MDAPRDGCCDQSTRPMAEQRRRQRAVAFYTGGGVAHATLQRAVVNHGKGHHDQRHSAAAQAEESRDSTPPPTSRSSRERSRETQPRARPCAHPPLSSRVVCRSPGSACTTGGCKGVRSQRIRTCFAAAAAGAGCAAYRWPRRIGLDTQRRCEARRKPPFKHTHIDRRRQDQSDLIRESN